MIKLLRVDKRLLHGQVAFTWTASVGADCILIACDSLQNDPLRLTTIKLSKPGGVKLVIKDVESSIEAINSGKTDPYQLLVIVESIGDAYRMVKGCTQFDAVSVGYTGDRPGCSKLTNWVFATQEEIDLMLELEGEGLPVALQDVPTGKSIPIKRAI